jgi:hypothetical protein
VPKKLVRAYQGLFDLVGGEREALADGPHELLTDLQRRVPFEHVRDCGWCDYEVSYMKTTEMKWCYK